MSYEEERERERERRMIESTWMWLLGSKMQL